MATPEQSRRRKGSVKQKRKCDGKMGKVGKQCYTALSSATESSCLKVICCGCLLLEGKNTIIMYFKCI